MAGLLQMATNGQIDQMKRSALPVPPAQLTSELASYVRKCWNDAWSAKSRVHQQLIANSLAFNSEYEPTKLAEIRKLKGSEQFIALTATKCNAAIAQIMDIIFQPDERPWDIAPTPVPEMPMETEQKIRQQIMEESAVTIAQYAAIKGIDPNDLMDQMMPAIRERIQRKLKDLAEEGVEEMKVEMDDQLVEGGWYEALAEVIHDVVVYKAGVLKGPIFRKKKYFKRVLDPLNGTYSNQITERIVPSYERRSPFNIYPAPDSTGVNDTYLFDKLSFTVKDLNNLIGVEGFNEGAIRRVISSYHGGGLRDWTSFDTQAVQAQTGGTTSSFDTDKIDVLEYNGDIQGSLLKQWGMSPEDVPDPDARYDVCVWLIGSEVIKAMLNPNPMGYKPFSIAGYIELPGSFWHKGLPELISDLQQVCNAMIRAIVNNAAISSGPLVEWNSDRVDMKDQFLHPWKVIEATDSSMTGTPAVRFYQPQSVTAELLKILDYFSKLADQYSIPSYAHGDLQVGGAGNTVGGLNMLMASAHKVIKNVIKNIDAMIENSVRMLYFYNVYYEADKFPTIGDVEIEAKGSRAMLQKEQQAVRRTEFLTAITNPILAPVVGNEGYREILTQMAQAINLNDLSKVFPQIDEIDGLRRELEQIIAQQQGMMMGGPQGSVPPQGSATLDQAGNSVSGEDTRLIPQEAVQQG